MGQQNRALCAPFRVVSAVAAAVIAAAAVVAPAVAAIVIAATTAAATAVAAPAIAAPGVVTAATENQDDDDDEPQAGTVVAIVEIHDCHLASRHSMRRALKGGLAMGKLF